MALQKSQRLGVLRACRASSSCKGYSQSDSLWQSQRKSADSRCRACSYRRVYQLVQDDLNSIEADLLAPKRARRCVEKVLSDSEHRIQNAVQDGNRICCNSSL